jgi:hypothetical protein
MLLRCGKLYVCCCGVGNCTYVAAVWEIVHMLLRCGKLHVCCCGVGNSVQRVAGPAKLLSDKSSELYCAFQFGIFHVRKHFQSITWTHYLRICLCVHYTRRWSEKNAPFVKDRKNKGWKGKSNYVTALCVMFTVKPRIFLLI